MRLIHGVFKAESLPWLPSQNRTLPPSLPWFLPGGWPMPEKESPYPNTVQVAGRSEPVGLL